MKLYKNMKKRLAKKYIGYTWKQLNIAKDLKVGDIVHTCRGYNEIIREIKPEYSYWLKKGIFANDFEISIDAGYCKYTYCCKPAMTKDQIMQYWANVAKNNPVNEWHSEQSLAIIAAIKNNECPFDDNGMLLDKYKVQE